VHRSIEWYEETERLQAALARGGAFLMVNSPDGRTNPMTIGWAQIGIVWSRPVLTVLVRESRHTYDCIREASAFTVSVPRAGEFSEELLLCGTKSGRDIDKVVEGGLSLIAGQELDTPVIEGCVQHYECKILARSQQTRPDFFADDVLASFYPKGDHHLLVFGEILAAYVQGE